MEATSSEQLRVLLVEDDTAFAAVVTALVRSAYPNAELKAVESVADAAAAISEAIFELVITDLDLPDSVGLATAQTVLEMANRVPVVVLTGNAESELGTAAIRLGAQDYLVKDELDRRTLLRTIRYSRERFGVTQELRDRSTHDDLTGVLNRTAFVEELETMLIKLQRGRRVEVLFVDIDEFKLINDLHGHAVGDGALVHVARILEGCSRSGDLVARTGGDEFVIAAQTWEATGMTSLASRIADALRDAAFIGGVRVPISASIGAAIADHNDIDAESLICQADSSMYRAKHARKVSGGIPTQQRSAQDAYRREQGPTIRGLSTSFEAGAHLTG